MNNFGTRRGRTRTAEGTVCPTVTATGSVSCRQAGGAGIDPGRPNLRFWNAHAGYWMALGVVLAVAVAPGFVMVSVAFLFVAGIAAYAWWCTK